MRDDLDWERIAQYLAGECSPAEAREIERAFENDPRGGERMAQLRQIWERSRPAAGPGGSGDVDAAWGRMAARLRSHSPRSEAPRALPAALPGGPSGRSGGRRAGGRRSAWQPRGPSRVARAGQIVAALLVAAAVVWLVVPGRAHPPRGPMREFATAPGEHAVVDLRDGTHVVLAAASKLRIPRDFGASVRSVELQGEAYFEVAHDPAKPFSVHAARAVTQVLGTRFSVRAYPGDRGVDVLVRTGRVALRPENGPAAAGAVLTTGQLGRLDGVGRTSVVDGFDVESALAWTSGRLAFDRTPFREVIPRLERWYGLTIQLSDSTLGARRLTASFQDESAERVLAALALLLDARVERQGRTVTVSARTRAD